MNSKQGKHHFIFLSRRTHLFYSSPFFSFITARFSYFKQRKNGRPFGSLEL